MTKLTLDDFINNPKEAMRKGYKPDFMSAGALAASAFSIGGFVSIKESFISVMRGEVIELPKNLIYFFLTILFVLLMPIFLSFWWVLVYFICCDDYKKAKKQEERLNKLL